MAIVGITTLAVVLFAIPLGVAVQRLYRGEAVTSLERDATRVAAVAPDDQASYPRAVRLPKGLHPWLSVGIYRDGGERIAGEGPARSKTAADAADGRLHQSVEHGQLTVSAPIPSDEVPRAMVRVSMPDDTVTDRIRRAWLLMAGLAMLVIGLGAALARHQAGRLAGPLERLTGAAQALGDGDFTIRAKSSGVREAEAAELALEATARRLGSVLDRERAFSADVSHQLRTPLTGLLLGLESALERPRADLPAAIRTAVRRGEHLQDIIEDLLRLARDAGPERQRLDTPALLDELRARWHGPLAATGRPFTIVVQQPLPEIQSMPSTIRQILDVLVDNAAVHGRGRITVEAGDVGTGLAIDVSDEGSGIADGEDVFARRNSTGKGHGIGLALARSLAEAEGGRLVLRRPVPPIFTLLLPSPGNDGQ
ncbi:HAMP domain-containing histidine kinase [Actinomadura alba]|uniref:histidine kinase n=2 Tax=Actinomadura alba TaxID=406431 RepID=A0ABR7LRT4_9ACTN|nr:HAMP domain-containing histidine kinase [Actinomadura alba]